ncbi:ABC transporter ATP-binding protein [Glaciecola sp. MF2-115]|uniref:ABC transporter ATP-binding protein n=1 Tax=Glaciecola sp. MF2-115 TaxID=3384827 RepID=UPI0039A366CD
MSKPGLEVNSERELAVDVDSLAFSYVVNKPIINIKKWRLAKSEHVFMYGPSGCGKSSLLNLLSGILAPQQGNVSILGQDLSRLKNSERDRFRAKHIGVVFQAFNLVPYLSVLDNIKLAMHFADDKQTLSKMESRSKVLSLLEALQLAPQCLDELAGELSVGQQQRVAIARALINQPELLIVDEPTSALDASAKDAFMKVLIDTATRSQAALIFVSHDMSLAQHFERVESMADINKVNDAEDSRGQVL